MPKTSLNEAQFEAELTAMLAADSRTAGQKGSKPKSAASSSQSEELAILLKQNLLVSQEVERLTKRIHSYIVFSQIMWWVKLVLFLVPVIMAFVYLPPFMRGLVEAYNQLLSVRDQIVSPAQKGR